MMARWTRRGFLGLLATGTVTACLATKIPTAWLPEAIQTRAACEFLRQKVNDWLGKYGWDYPPKVIVADGALFDAYDSELVANERFVLARMEPRPGERMLTFKGIPVRRSAIATNGWHATLVAGEREG